MLRLNQFEDRITMLVSMIRRRLIFKIVRRKKKIQKKCCTMHNRQLPIVNEESTGDVKYRKVEKVNYKRVFYTCNRVVI